MQGAGVRRRSRRFTTAVALTVVAVAAPWSTVVASATTPDARSRGTRAGALATLQVDAPTVQVKPAGKSAFVTAKDGRALKAGDTVKTSASGRAEIAYADGSLTRLDVGTEYKLAKLSAKKGDRKTKGVQTAGQTWHRVESLSGNDSYKVEGANATAAVLGTAFVVNCVTQDQCTFTAVVDPIQLTDAGPRNGTKTVTLTPGDQAVVTDDAIGPVTVLTQEELLAIQWIVQNLLADQSAGTGTGTSEIANQTDPPPTRPASSPVVEPPQPAPPTPPAGPTDPGDPDPPPPANEGPSAADDGYAMPEDTLLAIAAPGVLANDADPEGAPLSMFLTSLPQHGSLTTFADGAFVYFPDANFAGVDAFTYVAGDGTFGSNLATVTITVNPVNDAPVATNDAYAVAEDATLTVTTPGVLGNDGDLDGPALTAVLVAPPSESDAFALNANGSFTFTPTDDFTGPITFTYQAFDGALMSNVATVTITVNPLNDPPQAEDDSYTTDEDTPLVVAAADGVLDNDSDGDGDPLTAEIVTEIAGVLAEVPTEHGTVTLNADGSFTYTPDDDFHGTDSFQYVAMDASAESGPATVTITVESAADAPVAVADEYAGEFESQLVVSAEDGVLANDSDADGDDLTAVLVEDIDPYYAGTLDLESDGSFTFSPGESFSGEVTFTYKANDGETDSNTVTVTITVAGPENSAPYANEDEYETNEDTPLVVSADLGVLDNDGDPDDEAITAVLDDDVSYGTLDLEVDGSFTYTPDPNFHGEDSFTYHADDGELQSSNVTVTITVNSQNDAPTAPYNLSADCYSGVRCVPFLQDQIVVLEGTDDDTGPDDLRFRITSLPTGATLEYAENTLEVGDVVNSTTIDFIDTSGAPGSRSFSYQAVDEQDESSSPATSVEVWVGPRPNAQIHELDPGENYTYAPWYYAGVGVRIASIPSAGALYAGEAGPFSQSEMDEGGVQIGTELITFVAPETTGVYSFSWTVYDDEFGEATPVTEYFVVGGEPVVEDDFESTPAGTPVTLRFEVNAAGIGTAVVTCWAYGFPVVGSVMFGDGTQTYVEVIYTPPAEFSGLVEFYATACISGAWFSEGATGYVAVDYIVAPPTIGGPASPVDADAGDAVDIYITVDNDDPLPIDLSVDTSGAAADIEGTLELISIDGNTWHYRWTPDSSADVSFSFTASNGFVSSSPFVVSIDYDDIFEI